MNKKNETDFILKSHTSPRSVLRTISNNQINSDQEYSRLLPSFLNAKKLYTRKMFLVVSSTIAIVLVLVLGLVYTSIENENIITSNKKNAVVLPIQQVPTRQSVFVKGKTETAATNPTPPSTAIISSLPDTAKINFTSGDPSACILTNVSPNIGSAATAEKIAITADQNQQINLASNLSITVQVKNNMLYVIDYVNTGLFYIKSTASSLTYCSNSTVKTETSIDGTDLVFSKESI